ncbi:MULTISPECIES: 3-hydroxyanthranilate 3,4-dioxygenase [unclassified Polaribacter]|uniref:3-hydroxyanthranilate 3,4-dioxygenase n=1 Tax=unclassified Polaribacter TaxID=196858 RepID=UPI0011BE118F|nr:MULTISPECIES: 3-hydroxyanthranilate 3,4-dioxygenase [unclassified Polaribacter]TXD54381.1 3-hydroxyanthranilate 3,4-dioxygenase [Polaribacter sp. IC063]TXD62788.1 3-hydroxyanthranilate 3,4-dioxygenase [Polaribacter sp. IC066]
MSNLVQPLNFKKWIDEHRHLLKPPIGNKQVWDNGDFIVMVVGGPNNRKDYHYNETPEFFYQLEGDMILKIIDDSGKMIDVAINEGDIYLLPAKVPHSPQRKENTVGLVIEYPRSEGVLDALEWYCEKCGNQLYSENFSVKNIETDMQKIFNTYYSDTQKCTCNKCGAVMKEPKKVGS